MKRLLLALSLVAALLIGGASGYVLHVHAEHDALDSELKASAVQLAPQITPRKSEQLYVSQILPRGNRYLERVQRAVHDAAIGQIVQVWVSLAPEIGGPMHVVRSSGSKDMIPAISFEDVAPAVAVGPRYLTSTVHGRSFRSYLMRLPKSPLSSMGFVGVIAVSRPEV